MNEQWLPSGSDQQTESERLDEELQRQIQWKLEACKKVEELKSELAEVKDQLVESKMATDFANAACDLKDKRLDEYEAVLKWASENVESVINTEGWDVLVDGYSFHAPTLYEALKSAWVNRGEK